jgi:hypothetical protein
VGETRNASCGKKETKKSDYNDDWKATSENSFGFSDKTECLAFF